MEKIISIEDKSDAFDWAFALWYWFSHNHEGQTCPKYAAMCSIPVSNVPPINFDEESDENDENEMVKMYYHQITENNWEEIKRVFDDYMENDWNDED